MFRPLLISMFLTSAALADTWTVDDDGPADFDSIYLAVAAASDGDVILVMEGTYYESYINPHGKTILVEGETDSEGEPLVTINGMQSGAILEFYSGEGSDTIFRHFILTNGSSYYGGGMTLFDGSSPTVEYCIFRENIGTIEGGAIHLRENCNPIINNCIFENNIAYGCYKVLLLLPLQITSRNASAVAASVSGSTRTSQRRKCFSIRLLITTSARARPSSPRVCS